MLSTYGKTIFAYQDNVLSVVQYDQSPVYSASWKGHTAIVKLLIDHRADITICNKVNLISVTFTMNQRV